MRKPTLAGFSVLLVLSAFGILPRQKAIPAPAVEDFEIEGTGLFQCQCPSHACPCQTNGRPTHGTCYAADFAHIKSGHYGKVQLDGLNVVMVGDLVDANPERLFATLYMEQKASPAQRESLEKMLEYLNSPYVSLSNDAAPVMFSKIKAVPMEFHESSDRTVYTLQIPGVLEEKVVLKRDSEGQPVSTITAMDSWSNTVHYADNIEFKYHDQEVEKSWNYSGRQANVKYFHLTKKVYENKEMLGQHGDMSGTWTAKQKEIIRKAGLSEK